MLALSPDSDSTRGADVVTAVPLLVLCWRDEVLIDELV